jgi:hypothetical protein
VLVHILQTVLLLLAQVWQLPVQEYIVLAAAAADPLPFQKHQAVLAAVAEDFCQVLEMQVLLTQVVVVAVLALLVVRQAQAGQEWLFCDTHQFIP